MAQELVKTRRLLVDFENVQQIDLSGLADDFTVTVFVGNNQKSIPLNLVQSLQHLGDRVEWLQVEGNGKNALDFHIAYQLGVIYAQFPKAKCVILSKDSGFDPLVRHLKKHDFNCRRINSLIELKPQTTVAADMNYQRVIELLTKIEKKSRPRRRSTLSQHISAMFQKKLAQEEVERLLDLLFVEKKVTEANQTISYHF